MPVSCTNREPSVLDVEFIFESVPATVQVPCSSWTISRTWEFSDEAVFFEFETDLPAVQRLVNVPEDARDLTADEPLRPFVRIETAQGQKGREADRWLTDATITEWSYDYCLDGTGVGTVGGYGYPLPQGESGLPDGLNRRTSESSRKSTWVRTISIDLSPTGDNEDVNET